MRATWIAIGGVAFLLGLASFLYQWWAWRQLEAHERQEQREIRAADRALYRAQLSYKRQVRGAERKIAKAGLSPVRARYGKLKLHDDHLRVGRSEYALTQRTKAKVVGHGRGDQREVMVLLEDTTWPSSLRDTKKGKPNELIAQAFASETRVRAANALQARAARNLAIEAARSAANAQRANTGAIEAASQMRGELGDRHRGAGPPPPKSFWRPAVMVAGVVALLIGLSAPPAAAPEREPITQEPLASVTSSPKPTPAPAEVRASARKLVNGGAYREALSLTAALPKQDRSYVRRLISARAARVTQRALERGDRSAANRALQNAKAVQAPATEPLTRARDAYASANRRVADARRARSLAKAQRNEQAQQPAAAAADSESQSDESDYAGMTCAEIGHSFTVAPGSDPDHDANNDGQACEAY